MSNKKNTGAYFREIIDLIKINIKSLENDKKKYSKFRFFVTGISLNLRIRKRQLKGYEKKLQKYLDEGWIE